MHPCQTTKQILVFHLSLRSLWGPHHWEYNYSDDSLSFFHDRSLSVSWRTFPHFGEGGRVAGGITESGRNTVNQVQESRWKGQKASVSLSIIPTLCDPTVCSPPRFSVHGILQARILGWVPIPSPGDLPDPGIKPGFPAWQANSLPSEPPGSRKPVKRPVKYNLVKSPVGKISWESRVMEKL